MTDEEYLASVRQGIERRLGHLTHLAGVLSEDLPEVPNGKSDLNVLEDSLLALDDAAYELYAAIFGEDRDAEGFADKANDYLFNYHLH